MIRNIEILPYHRHIELTGHFNSFKVSLSVLDIKLIEESNGYTTIYFPGGNIAVKELYEEVWELLTNNNEEKENV